MTLSQKEILQAQAEIRMAELRKIGENINHYKANNDNEAVKREEAIYRDTEDKLQITLMKIRELYGE